MDCDISNHQNLDCDTSNHYGLDCDISSYDDLDCDTSDHHDLDCDDSNRHCLDCDTSNRHHNFDSTLEFFNDSRQRGAIERFQPTGLSTSIPLLPQLLKPAGYYFP